VMSVKSDRQQNLPGARESNEGFGLFFPTSDD